VPLQIWSVIVITAEIRDEGVVALSAIDIRRCAGSPT
jgi:hypothetical protein